MAGTDVCSVCVAVLSSWILRLEQMMANIQAIDMLELTQ